MLSLDEAIKQTDAAISSALGRFSGGLEEMTAHIARAIGKGVRMRLLLNAAMNEEGYIPLDAPKAAAAIELLHMATLVHDDVIDDAPVRRGIETLQKKFGKKNAVICGDYLLSMSLCQLAGINMEEYDSKRLTVFIPRFSRALASICQGEYKQNVHLGDLGMNFFTYLRIISGKTAALFYISAYLGGILGGEDEKTSQAIGRFGQYLGIAFQIVDDCKDYELSEEKALKSVGNDIANGVVTLPLIMALKQNPVLRDLAKNAITNRDIVPRLIAEVRTLGGPDKSREIVRRYDAKARTALKNVSGIKREQLLTILDKALHSGI